MEEKKIATSVDLLINVGQFEHIQITKYAEKKISYDSQEDMIKQEDELTSDLVNDVIRTMRTLPEKLGKKTNAVSAIEEKIQKKIPAWLDSNEVPNIANGAQKQYDKNIAKASAQVENAKANQQEAQKDIDDLLGGEEASKPIQAVEEKEIFGGEEDDYFV
jgi:hypothetical protein